MRSVGRGPLDLSFDGDTGTRNTSLVSLLNNKKPDSSEGDGLTVLGYEGRLWERRQNFYFKMADFYMVAANANLCRPNNCIHGHTESPDLLMETLCEESDTFQRSV